MKLIFKFFFISAIFTNSIHCVDTIISIFLLKYPYFKTVQEEQNFDPIKYSQELMQPDAALNKFTKKEKWNRGIPGIMCLYAGNVATSDSNGQIEFKKLQQTSEIFLIISKGIGFNPNYIIAPSTIANWGQKKETSLEVDTNQPYEIYKMSFKKDPTIDVSYYEVEKSTFPEPKNKTSEFNNKRFTIPLNTIVIISDPKDILVPTGATITQKSSNITLPPIYIKKSFCFVYNSLFTLAIKPYFSQETTSLQLENQTVSEIRQRRY